MQSFACPIWTIIVRPSNGEGNRDDTIKTGHTDRAFDDPLLTFDLPALLKQIKSEETWRTAQRSAMTLAKTQELRVVLVTLHAGAMLPPHRAEGAITVQTVQGEIKFSAATKTVSLKEGQMLTLQKGLEHSVEAVEESAFLLTIAI